MYTADPRITRRAIGVALGMTGAMYALLWMASTAGAAYVR
jgi:hypothetical protein